MQAKPVKDNKKKLHYFAKKILINYSFLDKINLCIKYLINILLYSSYNF